jgi:hypothetical protein
MAVKKTTDVKKTSEVKKTTPEMKTKTLKTTKASVNESVPNTTGTATTTQAPIKIEADKIIKTVKEKSASLKKQTLKAKTTKESKIQASMHVQFNGKSYDQDELLRIAKDVWKYDLQKKPDDLKTVELYIKPEESMGFCVYNGVEKGSFLL